MENLEPNMVTLNAQARTLKSGLYYPGVKAISEDSMGIKG